MTEGLPLTVRVSLGLGCLFLAGCRPSTSPAIASPKMPELQFQVFDRYSHDQVAVVLAAIPTPGLQERLPYALTFTLDYKAQPNGLPATGEMQRLTGIEEKVIAALKPEGAVNLGHISKGGVMKSVFYAHQPGPASLQVTIGMLKKLGIKLEWKHDPNWDIFKAEFVPTQEENDRQQDMLVIRQLTKAGDDHSKVRPVDFTALFQSERDREAFIRSAKENGFRMGQEGSWQEEDGKYWCELTKDMSVQPDVVLPARLEFQLRVKQHGGEFDGWACPVTK